MKTRFFSYLLPAALLLLVSCGNPDGTDSMRDSMDDNEEIGPRRERGDTSYANPEETKNDGDTYDTLPTGPKM